MSKFRFTGPYRTVVSLPDGSTVTVNPGQELPLRWENPGPLWAPVPPAEPKSRTNASKATKAPKGETP